MPRAQNAHAYVNAAFLFKVEKPSNQVVSANICFGGIESGFTHAKQLEELYVGKCLFDAAVAEQVFGSSLKTILQPDHVLPDASPEYRTKLAAGLFYKFLLHHAPQNDINKAFLTGGDILKRPVSSGKQTFETVESSYPVTKPTEKHEGLIQTAGEATYANDIPVQPNQVWAAFVTATKVGAKVANIDASEALQMPGVVAFFGKDDIPGTNNVGGTEDFFFPEVEELFPSGAIRFYNQPVGVIVAESNALANKAAEFVKITYEEAESTNILPTQNDVLNSASSSDRIQHVHKSIIKELNISESYDIKASGKLDMGLQYHFYMEPQTTIVIPFEGGYQVHCATQWMDLVQRIIANMLNLKNNEVQVQVRRLGGGYGGKATRCNPAACAAALVAYKLNRPVRFVQSLESMMNVLGKRWGCLVNYDFYVKNSGKIVAINSSFYEDAGYLPNESPLGHTVLLSKNCYEFSDNYKLDGYIVLSDSPSNTPCRAPGSVEGIAIMENIIEQIAFETNQDPVDVRLANLLPGHKMHSMLDRFLNSSNYKQRRNDIIQFNKENRWIKKGLGMAIMEYHIGYFGQYPATVAIYHGDGTVIISHGGIEMGQGMNTKIAQVAAHTLGIPMEMIKFERSDTVNGANSMVTGGAVGSETLCFVS